MCNIFTGTWKMFCPVSVGYFTIHGQMIYSHSIPLNSVHKHVILLCTESWRNFVEPIKLHESADKAESNQHIVSPACQNSEQQLNSNFATLLHVQLHVTLCSYSLCIHINFSWTYSPCTNNNFDSWQQEAAKELPPKLDGSQAQCTAKEPPRKSDSTFSR